MLCIAFSTPPPPHTPPGPPGSKTPPAQAPGKTLHRPLSETPLRFPPLNYFVFPLPPPPPPQKGTDGQRLKETARSGPCTTLRPPVSCVVETRRSDSPVGGVQPRWFAMRAICLTGTPAEPPLVKNLHLWISTSPFRFKLQSPRSWDHLFSWRSY